MVRLGEALHRILKCDLLLWAGRWAGSEVVLWWLHLIYRCFLFGSPIVWNSLIICQHLKTWRFQHKTFLAFLEKSDLAIPGPEHSTVTGCCSIWWTVLHSLHLPALLTHASACNPEAPELTVPELNILKFSSSFWFYIAEFRQWRTLPWIFSRFPPPGWS